jgi:acetyltransferase-like isoleucine patch superfamily enzyme
MLENTPVTVSPMSRGFSNDRLHLVEDCDVGPETEIAEFSVLDGCDIGRGCQIWRFVNMYGCEIGDECLIGSMVEIQSDVTVGDRSRVQSHSFVCDRVTIGSEVFVGHGVTFINDRHPPSGDPSEWEETVVGDGAAIGSNATVMPVEIGENALVGAGSVVVDDVPANGIVVGNPAELIGYRDEG